MMRLLDAKSSQWAIRHIYVIMAATGFAILAIGYPIVAYLADRNQELIECGFDCHNFMYYYYGGGAAHVWWSVFIIGGSLLVISPFVAIGYMLIRRGVTFKLKGSNVE